MAVISDTRLAHERGSGFDDPFHDPMLIGIGIVFVLVAIVILALSGLLYWGNVYHTPSWGVNSFPPPMVH
jgi:hypothetical protein